MEHISLIRPEINDKTSELEQLMKVVEMDISAIHNLQKNAAKNLHGTFAAMEGVMHIQENMTPDSESLCIEKAILYYLELGRIIMHCRSATLSLFDPASGTLARHVTTCASLRERSVDLHASMYNKLLESASMQKASHNKPKGAVLINPQSDTGWTEANGREQDGPQKNVLIFPEFMHREDDRQSEVQNPYLGIIEFFDKNDGHFSEFDSRIAGFIGHGIAEAEEHEYSRKKQISMAKKQKEMEQARMIQESFRPKKLPEISGVSLGFYQQPSSEVGGDYGDIVRMKDGRLMLIIADVSGHGHGPSLIMAQARQVFRGELKQSDASPESMMTNAGVMMADDLPDDKFITSVIACIDPKTNTMTYANAGHDPTLLYSAAIGTFQALPSEHFPLTIIGPEVHETSKIMQLRKGDIVFLGTDGIVEATNPSGEMFGNKRLKQMIEENKHLSMEELCKLIGETARTFNGKESPEDDITIVAYRCEADVLPSVRETMVMPEARN